MRAPGVGEAPRRPRTEAPATLDGLSLLSRAEAGAEWKTVREREESARGAWARLAFEWPVAAGSRERLELLCWRAATILEGPDSRLARAAHRQARPWDLTEEPLRSVLRTIDSLVRQAQEQADLVGAVRGLHDRFLALQARFAGTVPRAWLRWCARARVDEAAIGSCRSLRAADALRSRLDSGAEELQQWDADVREGVRSLGLDPDTDSPVALESRYELLLAVCRVDREPVHRHIAAGLRRAVRLHLDGLRLPGPDHPVVALAVQYASGADGWPVDGDELWVYGAALAMLHRLEEPLSRGEGGWS